MGFVVLWLTCTAPAVVSHSPVSAVDTAGAAAAGGIVASVAGAGTGVTGSDTAAVGTGSELLCLGHIHPQSRLPWHTNQWQERPHLTVRY